MNQTQFDKWVVDRSRENPRRSRRRYTLWTLFIVAVFAFLLGVLVAAHV